MVRPNNPEYKTMWLMRPPGILPRDGKNISFLEMNKTLQTAYNLSPSLCLNVYTTYFPFIEVY